jgi:hypothetical protein
MGKGSKKKRTGSKATAVETKTEESKLNVETKTKDKSAEITRYLGMLKKATERHEKCRIRAHLRRLGHRGGLRSRTWHDEKNVEHIVEKKTA